VKKVTLSIMETLKYQREMIIEVPDEMLEAELNGILDEVQRRAQHVDDIASLIQECVSDIKIIETPDSSTNSPYDTEIEIDDMYIDEEEAK
jgi:hypothetical protein